jgi:hypothetical protein
MEKSLTVEEKVGGRRPRSLGTGTSKGSQKETKSLHEVMKSEVILVVHRGGHME